MSKIAVVTSKQTIKGGAQSVCFHLINSLKQDHDVTLFTPSPQNINYDEIKDFYGFDEYSSVDLYDDKFFKITSRVLLSDFWKRISHSAGRFLNGLNRSFFIRSIQKKQEEFDLLIWVYRGPNIGNKYVAYKETNKQNIGEDKNLGLEMIDSSTPTVRYIHMSYYIKEQQKSPLVRIANTICEIISKSSPPNNNANIYLSNSEWTGNNINQIHNVRSKTVYPPVNQQIFSEDLKTWEERENGFVIIGRITPDKRIHECISIIESLQKTNHDVHLHIIGKVSDHSYADRIQSEASEKDYIHYEGEVSFDKLVNLVKSHKFGIHGKKNERFGIAIAEMMSAGTIPFVHDSGGQRELVDPFNILMYKNQHEAVENISNVLSDSALQKDISDQLRENSHMYDTEEFEQNIRSIVESVLSNDSS